MSEQLAQRAKVCAIAREYIGTPYHNHGMVKGAGVDCATLLIKVFAEAGLIEEFIPEYYSPQWFLHHGDELYLKDMLRFAKEVETPKPGDAALFRVGRLFAHGAIVLDWPLMVHASKPDSMVCLAEADKGAFSDRTKHPVRFFSYWD